MDARERIAKGIFQAVYLIADKEIDQRWEKLSPNDKEMWGWKAEIVTDVFKELGKPGRLLNDEEKATAVNRGIDKAVAWSKSNPDSSDIVFLSMRESCIIDSVAQAQLDQRGE